MQAMATKDDRCMVRYGILYKRYDAKKGKTPPPWFEPVQPNPDPNTGHWPGWIAVGDGPEDRWFREAFDYLGAHMHARERTIRDGTYELCGPKINGNPEKFESHVLVPHGKTRIFATRSFGALREWLSEVDIEGIVWHHSDGRMAKIKVRDFGLRRR